MTIVNIDFLLVDQEATDFTSIANTDCIQRAIDDANLFMKNGKYDSVFDRIHTAFQGFLKSKLDEFDIEKDKVK